jgi:hypothetical protein
MQNEEIKKAVKACEYYSALFAIMKRDEEMDIEILVEIKMLRDEARQELYSLIERQSYKYYYHGA